MTVSRTIRALAISTTLLCMAPTAMQAMAASPQQGSLTVTSVSLHLESAASKIKPNNPSLTQVRAGQPVRIILYAKLTGLTQGVTAHVSLIIRGGIRDFASRGAFPITRKDLGGGTYGTRWFWNVVPPCGSSIANCLPRQPGSYTATGVLQINGRTYSQTMTLTVVG